MTLNYKNLLLILGFCLLWCSFRITFQLWRRGRVGLRKENKRSVNHWKLLSNSAMITLLLIYCGRVFFMFVMGLRNNLSSHAITGGIFAMIPPLLVGIILIHRNTKGET